MARPIDQNMSAIENIVFYTPTSQEKGAHHTTPQVSYMGKHLGQSGGRGTEGNMRD